MHGRFAPSGDHVCEFHRAPSFHHAQPVNNNGARCRCVEKRVEPAMDESSTVLPTAPASQLPDHEGGCSCAEGEGAGAPGDGSVDSSVG